MKLKEFFELDEREMMVAMIKIMNEYGYTGIMGSLPESGKASDYASTYSYYTKSYTSKYRSRPNFVYAKGDIPILLVAHVDTVFSTLPARIFFDKKYQVMWSPDGLGADDRAGVYAIYRLLLMGLKPYVLLTDGEETGGDGATAFVNYILEGGEAIPFRYIIQLDRKGNNEAVFYGETNQHFIDYIVKKHKWKKSSGSFSDISIICPDLKVSGVNVSVGYENNHFESELLYINHLNNTINKVAKMLREVPDKQFIHEAAPYRAVAVSPIVTKYTSKYEKESKEIDERQLKWYNEREHMDDRPIGSCKYNYYDDGFGSVDEEELWICLNPEACAGCSEYEDIPCTWICGTPTLCEYYEPILEGEDKA